MVIAQRLLLISGSSGDIEVPVRLFQPALDDGMWVCRYEIGWPEQQKSYFAAGIDSFQALILAVHTIGVEVYASAYHKAGSLSGLTDIEVMAFPSGIACATC